MLPPFASIKGKAILTLEVLPEPVVAIDHARAKTGCNDEPRKNKLEWELNRVFQEHWAAHFVGQNLCVEWKRW
jgi:hypothetical protein